MQVSFFPVTAFQQNCSVIHCEKTMKGAVVDPGGDLGGRHAALDAVHHFDRLGASLDGGKARQVFQHLVQVERHRFQGQLACFDL